MTCFHSRPIYALSTLADFGLIAADPCPIANVYALKALSLVPEFLDSPATRRGVEMLLGHWERRDYLFGMGSDFRKLKSCLRPAFLLWIRRSRS